MLVSDHHVVSRARRAFREFDRLDLRLAPGARTNYMHHNFARILISNSQ
jgi:hypothetical protein